MITRRITLTWLGLLCVLAVVAMPEQVAGFQLTSTPLASPSRTPSPTVTELPFTPVATWDLDVYQTPTTAPPVYDGSRLDCPDYPLSPADRERLAPEWVTTCQHCLDNFSTATATSAYPLAFPNTDEPVVDYGEDACAWRIGVYGYEYAVFDTEDNLGHIERLGSNWHNTDVYAYYLGVDTLFPAGTEANCDIFIQPPAFYGQGHIPYILAEDITLWFEEDTALCFDTETYGGCDALPGDFLGTAESVYPAQVSWAEFPFEVGVELGAGASCFSNPGSYTTQKQVTFGSYECIRPEDQFNQATLTAQAPTATALPAPTATPTSDGRWEVYWDFRAGQQDWTPNESIMPYAPNNGLQGTDNFFNGTRFNWRSPYGNDDVASAITLLRIYFSVVDGDDQNGVMSLRGNNGVVQTIVDGEWTQAGGGVYQWTGTHIVNDPTQRDWQLKVAQDVTGNGRNRLTVHGIYIEGLGDAIWGDGSASDPNQNHPTATPPPTATRTLTPSPSPTPLADAYCAEYLFRDDTPIVEVPSELVSSFEGECVAIIPELQVDLPFDIGSLDIDAYYVCPTYWTVASITMFGISFGVNWLFVIPLIFIYRQFMKL